MPKSSPIPTHANRSVLEVNGLSLLTPQGRPLINHLDMSLGQEKVALIGRNGVGKSSLLHVLAAQTGGASGSIRQHVKPCLVAQRLNHDQASIRRLLRGVKSFELTAPNLDWELGKAGLKPFKQLGQARHLSHGELRKLHLLFCKLSDPALLLLDEPTEDLDDTGRQWLYNWLGNRQTALITVSHDRSLLARFEHFFLLAESGCRYFHGKLEALDHMLDEQHHRAQNRYLHQLQSLLREEEHFARTRRRRRRKKNVGRISELRRRTSRARLNEKRSQTQVSQGRLSKIRRDKIQFARDWTRSTRRALSVKLPLRLTAPVLPADGNETLLHLQGVGARGQDAWLFKNLNLKLKRERLAITGPNGSGKTTLLTILLGNARAETGQVCLRAAVGSIAQGGMDWLHEDSLYTLLWTQSGAETQQHIARILAAHRFPLALAIRPLHSLSPGERVRAALICLFQRKQPLTYLVLDEPTDSLDYLGETALREALKAWPGGLIVVSHNHEFIRALDMAHILRFDGAGGHVLTSMIK